VRVRFTSDPHFGDRRVARHRGFGDDVEAHDATLADNWRRTVHKDDNVWVLGDLALSSPAYALEVLADLPGHKHLVWGNHDGGHPMHRTANRHQRRYLEVFESVQQSARRRIEGRQVLLSHFPYEGDHTEEDRHTQWRLRDQGVTVLHGHTHSRERVSWAEGGRLRVHDGHLVPQPTLQIHVGMDAWGLTPAPLHMVAATIEQAFTERREIEAVMGSLT